MQTRPAARISGITFENFKGFEQYSLTLEQVNILVGPNNSGKSTIIGALRALDSGLGIARSRSPERVHFDESSEIGYRIPRDSLPISLENVHSNYNTEISTITFRLNNRHKLRLVFPTDGGCVLVPEVEGEIIRTAAAFIKYFPISLTVVPVLGPVEHEESGERGAPLSTGFRRTAPPVTFEAIGTTFRTDSTILPSWSSQLGQGWKWSDPS